VMTVDPGFGGQKMISAALDKVRRAHELWPRLMLEVDGGIDAGNAREAVLAGAAVLVAGSAVFAPGADPAERIAELRRAAHESA